MSFIPKDGLIIWPGTNASIPEGYVRETSFDDKYLKSYGTEAINTTGGNLTHTHTSSGHGHTLNSHTHDVVLSDNSSPAEASSQTGDTMDNHRHVSAAIGGVSGGSLNTTSPSWGSANHEPPYKKFILIKATTPKLLPNGAVVLSNSATIPTDYVFCDGGSGSPDYRNKYLKGASSGGDAGATGGSLNHGHDISHTHTVNSHTHSGQSGVPNDTTHRRNGSGRVGTPGGHRHTINLNATTDSINSYSNTNAGISDSVEPRYYKLLALMNAKGDVTTIRRNMIIPYLISSSVIPAGWRVCNGAYGTPDLRDYFIKIANTTGEIGNTGGSNTHAHSSVSHTHTSTGTHTHTGPNSSGPDSTREQEPGGEGYGISTHTHPILSVGSATASYANSNVDCATVNNEPPYRTVAFIQFKYNPNQGLLLAFL